jgi:hypothetical protein
MDLACEEPGNGIDAKSKQDLLGALGPMKGDIVGR